MTKKTYRTEIQIETHEVTIIRFGRRQPIPSIDECTDVEVLAYGGPGPDEDQKENENETQS